MDSPPPQTPNLPLVAAGRAPRQRCTPTHCRHATVQWKRQKKQPPSGRTEHEEQNEERKIENRATAAPTSRSPVCVKKPCTESSSSSTTSSSSPSSSSTAPFSAAAVCSRAPTPMRGNQPLHIISIESATIRAH